MGEDFSGALALLEYFKFVSFAYFVFIGYSKYICVY